MNIVTAPIAAVVSSANMGALILPRQQITAVIGLSILSTLKGKTPKSLTIFNVLQYYIITNELIHETHEFILNCVFAVNL